MTDLELLRIIDRTMALRERLDAMIVALDGSPPPVPLPTALLSRVPERVETTTWPH